MARLLDMEMTAATYCKFQTTEAMNISYRSTKRLNGSIRFLAACFGEALLFKNDNWKGCSSYH